MRTLCPTCMDEKDCKVLDVEDTFPVREEVITVTSSVIGCQTCFTDFNNKEVPARAVNEAFKVYRKMHNMMTPEQIKYFRYSFNYSFVDLSHKTKIAPERLELIENGALQEKNEDQALKKAFGQV